MRTVKIAYTPPQRRSLWEKLRYKLAVRRKGGPVWARIGDTRQMVRRYPGHNSRRAFVQAVLAYGCSSLSGGTTAESSPPGGSPLCGALLPGTR